MSNYIYKCTVCDFKQTYELPMSFEPSVKFYCPECDVEDRMTRRIGRAVFPKKVGKVFAGDWFKKQYSQDIGEAYEDKARQSKDRKELEKEFRKRTGQ